MQENNFEKNIQKKLEQFKVTPSKNIWENIEPYLMEEPKKRFGYWWVSAAILFVIVGAFYYHKYDSPMNDLAQAASNQKIASTQKSQYDQFKKQSKSLQESKRIVQNINDKEASLESIDKKANHQSIEAFSKKRSKQSFVQTNNRNNRVVDKHTKITEKLDDEKNVQTAKEGIINDSSASIFNNQHSVNAGSIESESVNTFNENAGSVANSITESLNTSAATPIIKVNKKIKWVFAVSSGISGELENSSANKSIAYSSIPNGLAGLPVAPPVAVQPSWFNALQLKLLLSINNKWSFITGLGYTNFRNNQWVGDQADSARFPQLNFRMQDASQIAYTSGKENKLVNQFHALTLPIGFNYQTKLGSWPLSIQSTISYNKIVGGKYYTASNDSIIIFTNNYNNINKNWMNAHLAVTFHPIKKYRDKLAIGPEFYYQLNSIQSSNNTRKKVYAFALNAQFVLK